MLATRQFSSGRRYHPIVVVQRQTLRLIYRSTFYHRPIVHIGDENAVPDIARRNSAPDIAGPH